MKEQRWKTMVWKGQFMEILGDLVSPPSNMSYGMGKVEIEYLRCCILR